MNRFTCLYQNVRGINSKLSNLYLKSFSCDYSVIAFTESWLKPTTFDLEVFCDKYQVYRKDRLIRRGGGVLVAVHSSIPSLIISFSQEPSVEILCVRLSIAGIFIFITCSYIPPNSNSEIYSEHGRIIGSVMEMMSTRDIILVCGDFNIPDVSWRFCSESSFMVPANFARIEYFF